MEEAKEKELYAKMLELAEKYPKLKEASWNTDDPFCLDLTTAWDHKLEDSEEILEEPCQYWDAKSQSYKDGKRLIFIYKEEYQKN